MNTVERQQRLAPVIERYRRMPFAWGLHDCALFAARCYDAQADTDLESKILARYAWSSALQAIQAIKGRGTFEDAVSDFAGPKVPAQQLEFGDIVFGHGTGDFTDSKMLGVCDDDCFMVPGSTGLEWIPMTHALFGWRVKFTGGIQD